MHKKHPDWSCQSKLLRPLKDSVLSQAVDSGQVSQSASLPASSDGGVAMAQMVRAHVASTGAGCEGILGMDSTMSGQQACWTTRQDPGKQSHAFLFCPTAVAPCNPLRYCCRGHAGVMESSCTLKLRRKPCTNVQVKARPTCSPATAPLHSPVKPPKATFLHQPHILHDTP